MTDSGEHTFFSGDAMGEADTSLPRGEFNAAMKAMGFEIRSLRDELSGIKALLQAQTQEKINEARESGLKEAQLDELQKRMDTTANRVWYVAMGLAAQFLWNFFGTKGTR